MLHRRWRSLFQTVLLLASAVLILAACGGRSASGTKISASERETIIRQAALQYVRDANLPKAKETIAKLNLANPAQIVLAMAEQAVNDGKPSADIVALARLAEGLGARSPKLVAYLAPTATPSPLPRPTSTIAPPSPTTIPPTATLEPATATWPQPPPWPLRHRRTDGNRITPAAEAARRSRLGSQSARRTRHRLSNDRPDGGRQGSGHHRPKHQRRLVAHRLGWRRPGLGRRPGGAGAGADRHDRRCQGYPCTAADQPTTAADATASSDRAAQTGGRLCRSRVFA